MTSPHRPDTAPSPLPRPVAGHGLLDGKIALVTGASRGIGAAAARHFADEGARVVLAARGVEPMERIVDDIRASGGIADAVAVDLGDPTSIASAVTRVHTLHGRLDVAFNNAGVVQTPGPLDTTSDEEVVTQFEINFRAQWRLMSLEATLMRRTGGGAILNTSSIGSRRANPTLPAYGAMKRALNSITESAAVSWAAEGVRVNAITPGATDTAMMATWDAAAPGVAAAAAAASPLGRMATAEEVAQVAAFLLSDRASAVVGAILAVDGGSGA